MSRVSCATAAYADHLWAMDAKYDWDWGGPYAGTALNISILSTLLFLTCLIVPLISFGVDARHVTRVRCHAATALGRLREPASISLLAAAAGSVGVKVSEGSLAALRQILPILSADQY